ncbi:hypothetical protein JNW89_31380 [Micromonospora sp. 4G55]|nr:hypothetical protein [Micromonospora sp. 4G55]
MRADFVNAENSTGFHNPRRSFKNVIASC